MARINLIDSFQEFKEAENIDRPTLMKVMEDVFKTLILFPNKECATC
jgi:N utilization substance protein A